MFSSSEDEYFRTARKGYLDKQTTKKKLEPFRFRCQKIIDENFDSSEYESGSEETISNGSEEKEKLENKKNKKFEKKEIGNIDDFESSSSNGRDDKDEKADEDKQTSEDGSERKKFDERTEDDLKWLATFVQNQAASDFWKPPNETQRETEEDNSELPTKDNTENIQDKDEDKKDSEKKDETNIDSQPQEEEEENQESSSDDGSDLSSYVDRLKKLQEELLTVKKELAEAKKLAIEEKRRLIEEEEKRKKEKEQNLLNEGIIDVIACRKCSNSNISEWATTEICRPITVPSLTSYDFGTLQPREDPSANYRATLDSLEKLMNDELSNIKDNMGKLEPLKKTALDWETEAERTDKKSLVYRHDYTVKVISSQMKAETEVKP